MVPSRLAHSQTRETRPEPQPTRVQSLLEYALFAVFGGALVFAPVALVLANTASHRSVPNLVSLGMAADRVNILTIVTPKERTDAGVDALLLVSIKPSTREVAVVSIPSDLWVRLGRYGSRRLGSGVAVGRISGYPGGGPGLVSDTVANVLQQPVHAFVEIDPDELTRTINAIGGIDVEVTRGAYETRTGDRFARGRHHLDGSRALRYALSQRMAGEANDRFEREARQRAVLTAVLSRLPGSAAFRTNLTRDQFAWVTDAFAGRSTKGHTLAPFLAPFPVATLVDAGEALRPRSADFRQIQQLAADVFAVN